MTLTDWIRTHRGLTVTLTATTAVALIAAATTLAGGVRQQAMMIDDTALDLFHHTIDQPVVDYYTTLCATTHDITHLTDPLAATATDTIGMTPHDTVDRYHDTLTEITHTAYRLADSLSDLNTHAPRAHRPDASTDDTAYHGALDTMITRLRDDTHTLTNALNDLTSAGEEDLADHLTDIHTLAHRIPEHATEELGHALQHTRIFSEATADHITHTPECRDLLGPDHLDDDMVVESFTDFYHRHTDANTHWRDSLTPLDDLANARTLPTSTLATTLADHLDHAAAAATEAATSLDTWRNTETDPLAHELADHITPHRDTARDTYHTLASWAATAADTLRHAIPLGDNHTADTITTISNELRDHTIHQQKMVSTITHTLTPPTRATADAMRTHQDTP